MFNKTCIEDLHWCQQKINEKINSLKKIIRTWDSPKSRHRRQILRRCLYSNQMGNRGKCVSTLNKPQALIETIWQAIFKKHEH